MVPTVSRDGPRLVRAPRRFPRSSPHSRTGTENPDAVATTAPGLPGAMRYWFMPSAPRKRARVEATRNKCAMSANSLRISVSLICFMYRSFVSYVSLNCFKCAMGVKSLRTSVTGVAGLGGLVCAPQDIPKPSRSVHSRRRRAGTGTSTSEPPSDTYETNKRYIRNT